MDKFSFFILNIFINSFLAFFTVALLVEGIIFLFRIRQGRWTASLRTLPLLKLVLDLFLYDFSRWSYAQGINPLTCEEGTRTLSILTGYPTSSIQFTAPSNTTFTLADLVAYSLPSMWLHTLALLIVCCSLFFLIKKCATYYRSFKFLHTLSQNSQPLSREVGSASLKAYLQKSKALVLAPSNFASSPFVAGWMHPVVYISSSLSTTLSQQEYDSVLAHESEHIRYKDNLTRLILGFIQSLFWWIPTKWLQNRIEEGQEIGCDLHCKKYGIDPVDLASAISKSAHYFVNTSYLPLTHSLTKRSIFKRVHALLHFSPIRKTRLVSYVLGTAIACLVIFLGRFWIF